MQYTLRDEDARATLERVAKGELAMTVLPWIPLMRGEDNATMIEEWKRIAATEADNRWRSEYGALAAIFAELARQDHLWVKGLEGWNMQVSRVVEGWKAEADIARLHKVIRRAIELRYHSAVPSDLAKEIDSLNDIDELSRWVDATFMNESLEAFLHAVGFAVVQKGAETNGHGVP